MMFGDDSPCYRVVTDVLLEAIYLQKPITYTDLDAEAAGRSKAYKKKYYRNGDVYHSPLFTILGGLNDAISEVVSNSNTINKAPPTISAIIVRKDTGLPGEGIQHFSSFKGWENLSKEKKFQKAHDVQIKLRHYKEWNQIYQELFNAEPPKFKNERKYQDWDGNVRQQVSGRGGGEGKYHRELKEYVAGHPESIGIRSGDATEGVMEYGLLSGDSVDVAFLGKKKVLVEVKSRISSDDDIERGIYQCVKYRAVYCAWRLKNWDVAKANVGNFVRVVLVTENDISKELKALAKKLNVETKTVPLS